MSNSRLKIGAWVSLVVNLDSEVKTEMKSFCQRGYHQFKWRLCFTKKRELKTAKNNGFHSFPGIANSRTCTLLWIASSSWGVTVTFWMTRWTIGIQFLYKIMSSNDEDVRSHLFSPLKRGFLILSGNVYQSHTSSLSSWAPLKWVGLINFFITNRQSVWWVWLFKLKEVISTLVS